MNLVEQAIAEHWGEKCDDYEQGCPVCDAWHEYENLVTYGANKPKENDKHGPLLESQLRAFPDSLVLTEYQMFDALRATVPDWLADHKYEDWRYYEARHELGYWADNFYHEWKRQEIEQARSQWARSAFLYKSQYPDGFFYACGKKPDGTYRYVGYRFGLDLHEYASGFIGMEYKSTGGNK